MPAEDLVVTIAKLDGLAGAGIDAGEHEGAVLAGIHQQFVVLEDRAIGQAVTRPHVVVDLRVRRGGLVRRVRFDSPRLQRVDSGRDDAPRSLSPAACLERGRKKVRNCYDDYTQFLDRKALRGARIAVPPFPDTRAAIMNNAIDVLRAKGAYVEIIGALAPQLGICVSYPAPADCSTVLMYGQKRDLNAYLANTPAAPHHTLEEIIAFNAVTPGATKYGQAIFEAAESGGGIEFYLIEQEGSAYTPFDTAERCLASYRKMRAS